MAKLTWNGSYGFDLSFLNLSNVTYGSSYTTTFTSFIAYYGSRATRDEFHGSGFTYDADGIPTGGTVTSYANYENGRLLGSISGMSLSATALVKAASTYSTRDDMALYKAALRGNDQITGGRADDRLEGFGGNDKITGGRGADTFVFKSIRDSGPTSDDCDFIMDFSTRQKDRIDLSAIDANLSRKGNQAFSFIGAKEFGAKAGELRYEKLESYTVVEGDVNGDGVADFSIALKGIHTLSKSYFIL
jgi:Ca2+-binding RTX toxin-like protein